jgi:chromosome segregation ATPase
MGATPQKKTRRDAKTPSPKRTPTTRAKSLGCDDLRVTKLRVSMRTANLNGQLVSLLVAGAANREKAERAAEEAKQAAEEAKHAAEEAEDARKSLVEEAEHARESLKTLEKDTKADRERSDVMSRNICALNKRLSAIDRRPLSAIELCCPKRNTIY